MRALEHDAADEMEDGDGDGRQDSKRTDARRPGISVRRPGRLIYLKPSYPRDMAIDVRAYGNLHDSFPHEPTLNQFFTESQFESYRQLGESEAERLAPGARTLAEFFDTATLRSAEPEGRNPVTA